MIQTRILADRRHRLQDSTGQKKTVVTTAHGEYTIAELYRRDGEEFLLFLHGVRINSILYGMNAPSSRGFSVDMNAGIDITKS